MNIDLPFGIGTILHWGGYAGAICFAIILGAVIACIERAIRRIEDYPQYFSKFAAALCLFAGYAFLQDYWSFFPGHFFFIVISLTVLALIVCAGLEIRILLATIVFIAGFSLTDFNSKFPLANSEERKNIATACFANMEKDVDSCRDMIEWTPDALPEHVRGIAAYGVPYENARKDSREYSWNNAGAEAYFRNFAEDLDKKIPSFAGDASPLVLERDFWRGLAYFSWNTPEGFSQAEPLFRSSGEEGLAGLSQYFGGTLTGGTASLISGADFPEKVSKAILHNLSLADPKAEKEYVDRVAVRDYVVSVARRRLQLPFYETNKVAELVAKMPPETRRDWHKELDWLSLPLLASFWYTPRFFVFLVGASRRFRNSRFYTEMQRRHNAQKEIRRAKREERKSVKEEEMVVVGAKTVLEKRLVPPKTLEKLGVALKEYAISKEKIPKLVASLQKLEEDLLSREDALVKEADEGSRKQNLDKDVADSFQAMSEDLENQRGELRRLIDEVKNELRVRTERLPMLFGFLKQVPEQARLYDTHDTFTREAMVLQKELREELETISKPT